MTIKCGDRPKTVHPRIHAAGELAPVTDAVRVLTGTAPKSLADVLRHS